MGKTSSASDDEAVLGEFKESVEGWRRALDVHRLAPPDAGFGARLAGMALAAGEQARVCRAADAAGYEWVPHRAAESNPPYELRPGTGRRGPEGLWQSFDRAAARLSAVVTGRDMLEVAQAYEDLADAAADLADALAREDEAGRPKAVRTRARRSA